MITYAQTAHSRSKVMLFSRISPDPLPLGSDKMVIVQCNFGRVTTHEAIRSMWPCIASWRRTRYSNAIAATFATELMVWYSSIIVNLSSCQASDRRQCVLLGAAPRPPYCEAISLLQSRTSSSAVVGIKLPKPKIDTRLGLVGIPNGPESTSQPSAYPNPPSHRP